MTAKRTALPSLLIVLGVLLAFPVSATAQLVLGQYEDEAPLRTWNIFGFQTAPSIGRGDTTFTMADDSSVTLTNPALLLNLPRFTATINMSSTYASLNKYSIINTGVLLSQGNPSINLYALDLGGISYRFKGWAFALTVALTELYDRPGASVQSTYQGAVYYSIDFSQKGILRTTNLSIARQIGRSFQIGLGFNLVKGNPSREIVETYAEPGVTITDSKTQNFSGFYLNGGFSAKISDKWTASLVFRTPYTKKSQSHSILQYYAPAGGTDIKITADSSDTYKQPLILGAGVRYEFSPKFRVLSDLSYFNWSSYEVVYFGEAMERNFKDTFKWGLGAEYLISLRIFKADSVIPLRLGVVYDPQPMQAPDSAYLYFSAGTGLHWKMIALDFGASFGRESGSGNSLKAGRLSLSLSVEL